VVEGVNVVKKHVKPNPMKGTTGGVVDKTMPIHFQRCAGQREWQGVACWHQGRGRQEGSRLKTTGAVGA
jgi:large subunit ribosomal protein L24